MASQGAGWGLVLVIAALVPAAAVAQPLISTPLHGLTPLPSAPVPSFQPGTSETPAAFLKGRFLVGINFTHGLTPEKLVGSHWSVSPFFRNTPRRVGWGPSFGLSWFKGDITVAIDGERRTIGQVKVRPIMLGVGYTLNNGRARTTVSLVGGYAFTSARITAALPEGTAAAIDITDSWVVRPNVGLTVAMTRRLALVGSIGYIYTRPTLTVNVTQVGRATSSTSGSYRSDYFNVTVGAAVSIF